VRKFAKASVALSSMAVLTATSETAFATTSNANMNVGIQITSGCNISVSNLTFTTVQATALTSAQTSSGGGVFSYTCSPGANTPSLTAGHGNNYSTTNSTNQMIGGTSGKFLPYSLNLPSIAAFTGSTQTANITATIPAQASLPTVDTYSDTVVLTLNY
jgi:spore coat protein U-like protein